MQITAEGILKLRPHIVFTIAFFLLLAMIAVDDDAGHRAALAVGAGVAGALSLVLFALEVGGIQRKA